MLKKKKTASEKPCASSKSDCQGNPKAEKTESSHNLRVSPATVHHMEAVFLIVREIYGREHDDFTDGSDVIMATWSIVLSATLRADLQFVKNHLWKSVGQLFNE